jgi:hypothetical protein
MTRPYLSNLPMALSANGGAGTIMVQLSAVRELVPEFDLGAPQQARITLQSGERFESEVRHPHVTRHVDASARGPIGDRRDRRNENPKLTWWG